MFRHSLAPIVVDNRLASCTLCDGPCKSPATRRVLPQGMRQEWCLVANRLAELGSRSELVDSDLAKDTGNMRMLDALRRVGIAMCGMSSDMWAKRFLQDTLGRLSCNAFLQVRMQ